MADAITSEAMEPTVAADAPQGAVPPSSVEVRVPEFAALNPSSVEGPSASLDRLLGVTVTITAELGRVTFTIDNILKLGVGSIVELGRPVSEPVDLMVQGVRLARGEVVVVDDRFAVRIKEIAEPKKHP